MLHIVDAGHDQGRALPVKHERPRVSGPRAEEENMRIITRTELAHRSKFDLDAILAVVLRDIS